MTNKKISQLPSGSSIVSSNLFPAVQLGITYKVSASQILDYITGSTFNNLNVSNLSISSLTASVARINNNLTVIGDLTVNGGNITSDAAILKLNEGKTVFGTNAQFTSITGSLFGTASFASNANLLDGLDSTAFSRLATANTYTSTNTFSNFYITASAGITGSDAKFTTITGSLFGTASFASNANLLDGLDSTAFSRLATANTYTSTNTFSNFYVTASAGITGSDAKFTRITGTHVGSGAGLTNIPNSATTANSNNIPNTIVVRDASGNFTANIITASLFGNASTVTNGVYTVGNQTIGGIKSLTSPLTGTSAYFSGDLQIAGTASIGQLNTVNQTSLVIGDKYITILSGGVEHPDLNGAGFLWGTSSGPGETTGALGEHAHILYDASRDALKVFPGLYVTGSTNLFSISGTIAQFTVLTASYISASQIIGAVTVEPGGSELTVQFNSGSTFSGSTNLTYDYNTNILSGKIAQFTNITGSLFGTASYATNASTVVNGAYINATNNFNNTNTFSNFYVTASVGITGSDAKFTTITASILSASQIIGIAGGSGPEFSVQFKTGSQLSGTSKFNYDSTTETLNIENIFITGAVLTALYTVTQSGIILDEYHTILVDSTLAPITLVLPSASNSEGRELIIKKVDLTSNLITISASVGDIIDSYQYLQLDADYSSFTLKSDGFNKWLIFGETSAELNIIAQGYINLPGTNDFYILSSSAASGPSKSIQFNYFDILSGTSNLIYESSTLTLSGTNAEFSLLSSSNITGSDAKFTSITASIISASTYVGIPAGDVTAAGTNAFAGVNTFSNFYITASAGITGSDAKFTTITGSLFGTASFASNANLLDGLDSTAFSRLATANTYTSTNTFSNFYVTASAGITGSDAKFTRITGSLFGTASFASNADLLDGLDSTAFSRLATANTYASTNTFSNFYITASAGITGSDAKFTTITGTHVGSGAGLTNIPNSALNNSTITVGSTSIFLGSAATIIDGISELTASNIRITGTASIGQLNTINQTSLVVGDKYITILSGGIDHTGIDGSGFLWGTSSGPGETTGTLGEHAHILYDASRDALKIFPGLYVSGTISLTGNLSGNIAEFTVITASVISASTYEGLIIPVGDVTANGSNVFTGVNTFNTVYITASVGITGSDAKFATITGTILQGRLKNVETSVVIVSTNTTLTDSQHVVLASASVSNVTVTLPLANVSSYRQYIIKKIDNTINKIIISGSSGETIDGNMGREINTQYETVTLVSDGSSQWFIL